MRLDSEPWFPYVSYGPERQRVSQVEHLICWFWPPRERRRALWMAYHRSFFIPEHSPSDEKPGYGLFGVPLSDIPFAALDPQRAFNLIINCAAAHKLWSEGGWAAVNDGIEPTWPAGMEWEPGGSHER